MYYPMIIILFAFVVILFDSTVYLFLKVSPGDYRHFVASYLHQFLPKRELARIIEHFSIQGLVVVIEKSVKNLLQVMIANLVFSNFIPFWSEISPTCQSDFKHGGLPYSESVAAWLSTGIFYLSLPFLLHVLLNTAMYGISRPPRRTEVLEQDVHVQVCDTATGTRINKLLCAKR